MWSWDQNPVPYRLAIAQKRGWRPRAVPRAFVAGVTSARARSIVLSIWTPFYPWRKVCKCASALHAEFLWRGRRDKNWTRNFRIWNPMLYLLNYSSYNVVYPQPLRFLRRGCKRVSAQPGIAAPAAKSGGVASAQPGVE